MQSLRTGGPSAVGAGVPSRCGGKRTLLDTPRHTPGRQNQDASGSHRSRGGSSTPSLPLLRPVSRARYLRALFCPACCRYSACCHGLILRTACRCACETARRHAGAVMSLGTCLRRPRADGDSVAPSAASEAAAPGGWGLAPVAAPNAAQDRPGRGLGRHEGAAHPQPASRCPAYSLRLVRDALRAVH